MCVSSELKARARFVAVPLRAADLHLILFGFGGFGLSVFCPGDHSLERLRGSVSSQEAAIVITWGIFWSSSLTLNSTRTPERSSDTTVLIECLTFT